jgi:hypothetical protein
MARNKRDWTSIAVKKSTNKRLRELVGDNSCVNVNEVIEWLLNEFKEVENERTRIN